MLLTEYVSALVYVTSCLAFLFFPVEKKKNEKCGLCVNNYCVKAFLVPV